HGAADAESDSLGGDLLESGPMRLRTASVTRGVNASSISGGVSPEVGREGHAEIDYGGVIEILRNEVNGIEQSWRFDAAPTGRGDLIVTVEVGGQEYAGETESGL